MTEETAAPVSDNGSTEGATTTAPMSNDWTSGFDEATSAFVENKGWKTPGDAITSYQNLEKFAGGSKSLVELPGVDADESALNSFYSKLGRPDAPDNYKLNVPDGADEGLTGWFKNTVHQIGLSDKQASALFDAYNEMYESRNLADAENSVKQSEQAVDNLKREWGKDFEANVDAGRIAARELGYKDEDLQGLQDKIGDYELLKLFANIGSKMGEPGFAGGDKENSTFGLTPAVARQQLQDLKSDQTFMSQYLAGNKDAIAKMTRLNEVAYGK